MPTDASSNQNSFDQSAIQPEFPLGSKSSRAALNRVPTVRENLEKSGNFKISQRSGKSQGISQLLKSWRKYSKIKIFENIQKSGNFQNYPEKHGNCI